MNQEFGHGFCQAIREGDYKLIEFFEDGHLELYNLGEDIGENNNLAEDIPEEATRLRKKLLSWQKSVGAELPTSNPDCNPEKANYRGKHRVDWLDPKPQ
jgi:arylsulfatase A